MSLYPSLEDMQVDKMLRAQEQMMTSSQISQQQDYPMLPSPSAPRGILYPSLGDFMGLELSQAFIAENMPEYSTQLATVQPGSNSVALSGMVAPLSGNSVGLQRAQVTHGIREIILCKGQDNKIGTRVAAINGGIFINLVVEDSPAAMIGLRFGDQILEVQGKSVAGYTMDQVHDILKKSPVNGINIIVRDRPFERTITLHKDSTGHVGFQFKNGNIISLVKDSSASRNGLLTEHQLLEVNGQNVVGMKDKKITSIMHDSENTVTVTIMPGFLYKHMVKKMASGLLKNAMDHSIPAV